MFAVVFSVALVSWEAAIAVRAAKFALQMPDSLLSIPAGSSSHKLTRRAIFKEELVSLSMVVRAIPALALGIVLGAGFSLYFESEPMSAAGLIFSVTSVLFASTQSRTYLIALRDGMNRSNTLAYLRSEASL
jgi:hypothetical protein